MPSESAAHVEPRPFPTASPAPGAAPLQVPARAPPRPPASPPRSPRPSHPSSSARARAGPAAGPRAARTIGTPRPGPRHAPRSARRRRSSRSPFPPPRFPLTRLDLRRPPAIPPDVGRRDRGQDREDDEQGAPPVALGLLSEHLQDHVLPPPHAPPAPQH